jgi:hypothetical protein
MLPASRTWRDGILARNPRKKNFPRMPTIMTAATTTTTTFFFSVVPMQAGGKRLPEPESTLEGKTHQRSDDQDG